MLGREGRAQGGDHVGHTSLMQRDRVEVPFDDHDLLLSRDALACDLKPVQRAAFPEQRSLRRVQVLGHPVINHTPPEADDALLEVADRQDDPPAEAVVVARGIAGLFAALIPRDDQAGRGKILDRPSNLGLLATRSEEHTSELQSRLHLVCRLLLEKKKKTKPLATRTKPESPAGRRLAQDSIPKRAAQGTVTQPRSSCLWNADRQETSFYSYS